MPEERTCHVCHDPLPETGWRMYIPEEHTTTQDENCPILCWKCYRNGLVRAARNARPRASFLHERSTGGIDMDLLYTQKGELILARADKRALDHDVATGLIHLLDFIGDALEEEGGCTVLRTAEREGPL
jgi:hypothetical protein